MLHPLKAVSATILQICFFLSLKESCVKLGKIFFILLQKLFLFSKKTKFRILDIQISRRHQMPKYKTRDTFYCINWEVNTFCYWKSASFCHITKERILSKFLQKLQSKN